MFLCSVGFDSQTLICIHHGYWLICDCLCFTECCLCMCYIVERSESCSKAELSKSASVREGGLLLRVVLSSDWRCRHCFFVWFVYFWVIIINTLLQTQNWSKPGSASLTVNIAANWSWKRSWMSDLRYLCTRILSECLQPTALLMGTPDAVVGTCGSLGGCVGDPDTVWVVQVLCALHSR